MLFIAGMLIFWLLVTTLFDIDDNTYKAAHKKEGDTINIQNNYLNVYEQDGSDEEN